MLAIRKKLNGERGAAHLVLVLVFVLGLIGVLGFVGYSSWQRQNANASGEDSLGSIVPPALATKALESEADVDTVSGDTATKSSVAKTPDTPKECTPLAKPYPWKDLQPINQRSLEKNTVKVEALGASTYQVYGFTRAQVRTQLQNCAPEGGVNSGHVVYGRYWSPASAMWWLEENKSKNVCKINAFSVGMRTGRLQPRYTPSDKSADGLNETMKAYLEAIRTRNQDLNTMMRESLRDFRKSWVGYSRSGTCNQLASHLSAVPQGETQPRLWVSFDKTVQTKLKEFKRIKLSDF